jgi:hypothetical protein
MDIDAMIENYWDNIWEEMNAEDAWDRDDPDANCVYEIITDTAEDKIPDLVREYYEGDGDMMVDAFRNGWINAYVSPEDRIGTDDPDTEWKLVDRIFTEHWDDDDFMETLWEHDCMAICGRIQGRVRFGEYEDIRGAYNESRRH